ncbi:MAG: SDR family NAD(P)-dependent oxidoreductase [Erysipelotrichia bacterium]|nr:SDR family NAD(P)-dependent oxidoreductase [Erysipelotrichia bacterium]
MKIAIVSGASSGMGREFAKQFDDKHLDEIWVIARREDRLRELQADLLTPVRVFSFDLLKESSFEVFKHILTQENPTIKYLVNAAGFGVFGDSSMDLEIVNKMIDLNIKALVSMTYLCIPYMNKGSHIIELGSASSFTPLINFNIYASTKAFVLHFSNALYQELKPKGIKVSVICPGWVKTEFFKEANPKTARHAPLITRPLYKAEKVVRKAIADNEKGKMISLPGAFTKIHYVKAKFAPKKMLMGIWKKIQK